MKPVASALFVLGFVAALGHFTAGRVAAQAGQPTHQALQNQVSNLQTTVNSVGTKVDGVQSPVDSVETKIDNLQLNQGQPAWSQALPAADRFQLVLGGAAVLDKETELVWEQSPGTNIRSWWSAQAVCNGGNVGNRLGWRLPTLQELASLVDLNNPGGNPDLPPGHPFSNVQSSRYWSATTVADDSPYAWHVSLQNGVVGTFYKASTDYFLVWCVRGGHGGPDAQ